MFQLIFRRVNDGPPLLYRRHRPVLVVEPDAPIRIELNQVCVHRRYEQLHRRSYFLLFTFYFSLFTFHFQVRHYMPATYDAFCASATALTTPTIGTRSMPLAYAYSILTPAITRTPQASARAP